MKYRIGLDIGIGSIGWGIISEAENGIPARIVDFGTRIFDSGEENQGKDTSCRKRRGFRSARRLERRNSHRKMLLKNHLLNIRLLPPTFNDDLAECKDEDIFELKVKGLDEKLSCAQIYRCLIHTCNHRGYREFYEHDEDDDDVEEGKNTDAANDFENKYKQSSSRIISEFILSDYKKDGFVKCRNSGGADAYIMLIRQKFAEEEAQKILEKQKEYYPVLTDENIEKTMTIIFKRRDFEYGPGYHDDKSIKYHGFLETIGKCTFYKNEQRGFRNTVISDIYSVTNTLSQYRFISKDGEYTLDKNIAKALVDYVLKNAAITLTEIKNILKPYGFTVLQSKDADKNALTKSIKFLKSAKSCVENAGYSWDELISEEQFDLEKPSILHNIGELVSKFQTPKRRIEEFKKSEIEERLWREFANRKFSGTSNVSYRYMVDSINAFLQGETYGNFQANFNKAQIEDTPIERSLKLSPSHIDDEDIRNNRVVFKAINETRKIVNAIISEYGSPADIVIEVASELGKGYFERMDDNKNKKSNEKANDEAKEKIAKLLNIGINDVTGSKIERYKLYNEQEGKSIYSGEPLGELKAVLENKNKEYEIDHIVPYSLILDNTLNNKVLVFTKENQDKRQRTPLMYLSDDKKQSFLEFVNHLYSRKVNPISKKKLAYLKLESLYSDEAHRMLDDWKTRNINDTRYITKYIAGLFEKYLIFNGGKKQHVFTVKGAISQKFRREWLRGSKWGDYEKNRENYMNHAVDALVCANLTKPYIEIGSDALRLISIYKYHKSQITPEYTEYLESCIAKMKKYYGFSEEYSKSLLTKTGRCPSYAPNLYEEIEGRVDITDEDEFRKNTERLYGKNHGFEKEPQISIASIKPNKKLNGTIADSKYIKVIEEDGKSYKISRIAIILLTKKQFKNIYSTDNSLVKQLEKIFEGKEDAYTVEAYLKENSLPYFTTENGKRINKVSIKSAVSNFYRVEKGENNFGILGVPKYYCIEIYKNIKGETSIHGIRIVDIKKKSGKLYIKDGVLPKDYSKHIMYLFPGDFINTTDKNGNEKLSGYYRSVKNITRSQIYYRSPNLSNSEEPSISKSDTIYKYDISILGHKGGVIKCSAPFPSIKESTST